MEETGTTNRLVRWLYFGAGDYSRASRAHITKTPFCELCSQWCAQDERSHACCTWSRMALLPQVQLRRGKSLRTLCLSSLCLRSEGVTRCHGRCQFVHACYALCNVVIKQATWKTFLSMSFAGLCSKHHMPPTPSKGRECGRRAFVGRRPSLEV